MNTYSLIIKKIIKTDNNFFKYDYENDGIKGIFKICFNILLNKDLNIKNKFKFFIETLNNFCIKGKIEEEFIAYFCKIQKTYNVLNKFVHNYRYKKSKLVVNTDMCLNELNANDKNVMCLYHNNSKYLFHINDLIKIINSSLTNSYMFFAEPTNIKNPYDNIAFNKSTLYNIYFFIRYKTDFFPELFFKFFYVDFNLTAFKNSNEYLLRKYAIENYVFKSPSNTLIDEINNMIYFFNDFCEHYNVNNKILINKDFPKDILLRVMKPYLLIYFISQYSYFKRDKDDANRQFYVLLIRFNKFNPQFGRKKYRIIMKNARNFKRKIVGKITLFDDVHVKFNNIEKQNDAFLSDHLKYDEIIRSQLDVNYIGTTNEASETDETEQTDESDQTEQTEETDSIS